jgi:formylglycine-generating enzyme required for sulfatase activity
MGTSTDSGAAAVSGAPATSGAPAASGAPSAAAATGDCGGKCLSIEKCEAGACVPACPPNEVYVPKTPPEGFTMGRGKVPYGFGKLKNGTPADGFGDAPHNVVLTKPFCMDATEVIVKEMVRCVNEQGCRPPAITDRWSTYPRKLDYPVNMADWHVAREYCQKQGQDLPTEAQWQWAATGGDNREWPWGDEPPTCEYADYTQGNLPSPGGDAGCHGGGPSPVGTHLKGDRVLPTGHIHDLAGNVWEWTLDGYGRFPKEPQVDPMHGAEGDLTHVVRGGGWNRSHRGIMAWFRGAAIHTYKVPGLGFRCIRNPK